MRSKVKRAELDEVAAQAGLQIQHDCGGFRVVRHNPADGSNSYVFPRFGTCPTVTARECMTFLWGYNAAREDFRKVIHSLRLDQRTQSQTAMNLLKAYA